MKSRRQNVGAWGESLATDYLRGKGYDILGRNVRTPYGELDIIARMEQTTVFVEVKTRRSPTYGPPEEAITTKKREHLICSALAFLQEHPEYEGDWRIDVIAIQKFERTSPQILHYENAITG